jgi:hypothetical protein
LVPSLTGETLYELPAWHVHAGRILVGNAPAFSDDRGATWSPERYTADELDFSIRQFLVLPPLALLPGAASGRDPAMPVDWPVGRLVCAGNGGVAVVSDDAGDSYRLANQVAFGLRTQYVTLVRRPDGHSLGPGPRLLAQGVGAASGATVWISDDAGETWTAGANLWEPVDGPGNPAAMGIYALPEPGESDRGAGGRAVAVLGRGHIYQTTDGGDTWALVGRAPEMETAENGNSATFVGATALGPDNRLYIGVTRTGPGLAWMYRTAEPFFVAGSSAPSSVTGLSLSVRPNPSDGRVTVAIVAEASEAVRVSVLDALGREVAVVYEGPISSRLELPVETARLPPGVYVVRASVAGRADVTARFTVAR